MDSFANLCRICMCENAIIDIFEEVCLTPEKLIDKIVDCTQIQITMDDPLPKHICNSCYYTLNEAYQLRLTALRTDQIFREQLNIINKGALKIKTDAEDEQQYFNEEIKHEGMNNFETDAEGIIKTESIKYKNDKFKESNEVLNNSSKKIKKIKKMKKKVKHKKRKMKSLIKCNDTGVDCKDFDSNVHSDNAVLDDEECVEDKMNCDVNQENVKSDVKRPNTLYCGLCDIHLKHTHSFRKHMRIEHNMEGYDRAKDYICDMCGKSFHDKYGLQMHKRSHTGDRPFTCNICGQGFTQLSNMERHVTAKHQKMKPYKCDVCSKNFAYSSSLRYHQQQHIGQRNHQCNVCDKTFTRSYTLARHQLTHSHAKPYACRVCDKAYTQSNDLKTHVKKIHPEQSTEKLEDFCIKLSVEIN